MKRLQILMGLFMFVFASMASMAASIEIVECETTVEGKLFEKLKSHATITNVGIETINVQVVATPTLAEGHEIQVCTKEACNAPTNKTFTSSVFTMLPGETIGGDSTYLALITDDDADFDGVADGKAGVSKVNMAYVNAENDRDKVSYDVTFTVTAESSVEVWKNVSGVYPNPAKDVVTITLKSALTGNSTIEIYNEVGEMVVSKNVSSGENRFSVDVQPLQNGTYYFTISTDNSAKLNGKFVVE